MKIVAIFILSLFFLSGVFAACSNGQVDINSASLSELDELTGIGPAKGQAIIDARPFDSVDDLIDVSGVGEVTLQNILGQGLACVPDDDDPEVDDEPSKDKEGPMGKITSTTKGASVIMEINETPKTVINLESSRNSEQSREVLYESNNEKIKKYSIYAFAFFLILVILYLLFS